MTRVGTRRMFLRASLQKMKDLVSKKKKKNRKTKVGIQLVSIEKIESVVLVTK